jgi:glycosyltransferase involved in cell wall biosynthesis
MALASPDAAPWRRAFRSHMHFLLADTFARRASVVGAALARTNRYAATVSSGPPHAAHDAAMRIGEDCQLPFVMDMRDPWSDEIAMPEDLRSDTWRKAARTHETRCVSSARLVVVTSESHRALQLAKYPSLNGRVLTVMNGADPDPLPAPRPRKRFVIAFAGMIYLGRNPRTLFRAAARVVKETGASPDELSVEFMGDDACEGVPLARIAADEGLTDHFAAHGFHPRSEVLEFLAGASLLVSLPLRTSMTLPAKLFEYTRFDAWLLALAERGSATEKLLADTDADVVPPDDVDGIARVIASRFAEFRAGVRPSALNRDGRFDRTTQSRHLFNALDDVLA